MAEEPRSDLPPEELPLAAPCRSIRPGRPLAWVKRGWADLRAAGACSLAYGVAMMLVSHAITAATWVWGNVGLYLGLVTGFIFLGPLLALTLYAISRRLEADRRVTPVAALSDAGRALGNAMVFAVVLTVIFLVWARAAAMVHVFFPTRENPDPADLLLFLSVGTVVGALFSAIVFAASAFSLPMLMDRRTDTITAVITSINAVLRNKAAMAVWAAIIVSTVVIGALTAWIGFVVLLPLIGHATWHAYRETIDAEQWPVLAIAER